MEMIKMKARQYLKNGKTNKIHIGDRASIDLESDNIMEFIHIYKEGKRIGHIAIFNSNDGATEIKYTGVRDE